MSTTAVSIERQQVNNSPIRIAVSAGTHVICDAFVERLSRERDFIAIAVPSANQSAEVWRESMKSLGANIAIVDLSFAPRDKQDPLEALAILAKQFALIALVDERDISTAADLIRVGVTAAVLKTSPFTELVQAVRLVSQGHSWISPPMLQGVLDSLRSGTNDPHESLTHFTAREKEVMQLMVDGLGRQQIAHHLFLSVDTVRTHLRTIMDKLGVHSATEAVSAALAVGLRPRVNDVAGRK